MVKLRGVGILAAVMLLAAGAAMAGPTGTNIVTNGSFTQSPFSASSQFGEAGYASLPGWSVAANNTNTPFDVWYQAATATSVGATTQYGSWAQDLVPAFSANAAAAPSADFVALDGDSAAASVLSQSVSNLNVGDTYQLSFAWAAGQMQTASQSAYNVAIAYNLSSSALTGTGGAPTTAVYTGAYGTVSNGWTTVTSSFTATSASEILSFLAYGGPTGGPPMALLDSVALVDISPSGPSTQSQVPEPSSLVLLAGLAMLGMARLRRPGSAA